MTNCTPTETARADRCRPAGAPAAEITTAELMRGERELLIHHAGQTYRLRVTASNKLILVK